MTTTPASFGSLATGLGIGLALRMPLGRDRFRDYPDASGAIVPGVNVTIANLGRD